MYGLITPPLALQVARYVRVGRTVLTLAPDELSGLSEGGLLVLRTQGSSLPRRSELERCITYDFAPHHVFSCLTENRNSILPGGPDVNSRAT